MAAVPDGARRLPGEPAGGRAPRAGCRRSGRSTSAPSSATPTRARRRAATGFFAGLAESATRAVRRRSADELDAGGRGRRRRLRRAGRVPAQRTAPACPGARRRRRGGVRTRPRATSSARPSISRRPTPGAGRVPGDRGRAAGGGRADRARAARRAEVGRPRWTPTRATRSPAPTRCSPGCRTCPTGRSPSSAAPTSTSPTPIAHARLQDRAARRRRRRLLHRAERRLQPSRGDVVGGRAGPRGVLHVAGGHAPCTTRACPATTCRSPRPCTSADSLNDFQRLLAGTSGARRGLGAVRRAAGARAGLPRRRRRSARACSTPSCSARPGWSSTSACTCELEIPAGTGFHEGERWTPRARARVPAHPDDHRPGALPPTRSTATSAGRGRRRRTRSASGCGSAGRDAARARHGDAFDFKAFHTTALQFGGMGLDPLLGLLATI